MVSVLAMEAAVSFDICVGDILFISPLADTRTNDTLALGSALLQHQHIGVLPSSTEPLGVLPLLDPLSSTSMPECWVRGAIVIRMNSLIRGHSGIRWELIEKMSQLLRENITPMIPIRGSISASGGTASFQRTLFNIPKSCRSFPFILHCRNLGRQSFDTCI
jgi:hypothetical protein